MYKVVGVSKHKGKWKVRFANDMTRVKVLAKGGHEGIDLHELPKAMTKGAAVKFMLERGYAGDTLVAIQAADKKYNGTKTVKVTSTAKAPVKAKAKTTAKAKAPAVKTPAKAKAEVTPAEAAPAAEATTPESV